MTIREIINKIELDKKRLVEENNKLKEDVKTLKEKLKKSEKELGDFKSCLFDKKGYIEVKVEETPKVVENTVDVNFIPVIEAVEVIKDEKPDEPLLVEEQVEKVVEEKPKKTRRSRKKKNIE